MTPSLRARLLLKALKLTGIKAFASKPLDQFEARFRRDNRKREFGLPKLSGAEITEEPILEKYRCLRIQATEKPSERAILYFFGGGMLMAPDLNDVRTAKKLMEATGCDVWMAMYPLCLDYDIEENIRMAYASYKRMLEIYGAGNVSTCGCSSGGMLALAVGLYNNMQPEDRRLPMPRQIVPVSPGEVPWDEEEKQRMQALDPYDPMVGYDFMSRVEHFVRHGRTDLPEWMIHPTLGDYTGFPPVHFFYSEHETLYGAYPTFAAALDRCGVEHDLDLQPHLPHCYPVMTFLPEGKAAFARLAAVLRR